MPLILQQLYENEHSFLQYTFSPLDAAKSYTLDENDRQPEFTAVCRWNMERETCNRLVIDTQWGIIFTVPPAGGCQNSPNQEHCNTLLDDLHGSSSQLKYVPVHVSLFRTSARHSSDLKSNSYISVYFFNKNQPKSFDISWTLDALLYFYLSISSMDWNIYYLCLFVAFQASSVFFSMLFCQNHKSLKSARTQILMCDICDRLLVFL